MSARILVLGGTAWLGAAVARHALAAGHEVLCLARGVSGRVPEGARLVVGDPHHPVGVRRPPHPPRRRLARPRRRRVAAAGRGRGALAALADRAARWAFVSSGSVYADHSVPGGGIGGTPLPLLPPLEGDSGGPEQYGEAKVACEDAVRRVRGEDALVARSGLIAGYGDPSDRFGYWVGRCALAAQDGGPLLVPASLDQGAQVLDVLDLAAWLRRRGPRRHDRDRRRLRAAAHARRGRRPRRRRRRVHRGAGSRSPTTSCGRPGRGVHGTGLARAVAGRPRVARVRRPRGRLGARRGAARPAAAGHDRGRADLGARAGPGPDRSPRRPRPRRRARPPGRPPAGHRAGHRGGSDPGSPGIPG